MRRELSEFLDFLRYERNASAHTISGYRRDLTQFIGYIEERGGSLRKVDNVQIRGFLAQLHERKLKKSSAARKLAAIRSFFRFAVMRKWVAENPAKVVATPKQEKRVPSFLSEEEMAGFLDVPPSGEPLHLRDRAILELLYASGIRVSELVSINLEDANLGERLVRVRGKGKKERLVPFGRPAGERLYAYLRVWSVILDVNMWEMEFFFYF